MLKSITNLGAVLSKTEQKSINGGLQRYCDSSRIISCTKSPRYTTVECVDGKCVYSNIPLL